MSRRNHTIPIFAITTHVHTLRKVTLYKGVYPAHLKTIDKEHAQVNKDVISTLESLNVVQKEDLVIITNRGKFSETFFYQL